MTAMKLSTKKEFSGKLILLVIVMQAASNILPVSARFVDGHYVIDEDDIMTKRSEDFVDREKRYTDSQENASAYCTGMCMFEERKPYSYCFDLCNWNGRSPNPWDLHRTIKFEESKKGQAIANSFGDSKDGHMLRGIASKMSGGRHSKSKNF